MDSKPQRLSTGIATLCATTLALSAGSATAIGLPGRQTTVIDQKIARAVAIAVSDTLEESPQTASPVLTANFTTKKNGGLIIEFCAALNADVLTTELGFRLTIDGSLDTAHPDFWQPAGPIDPASNLGSTRCFTWIADNVKKGAHAVQVEWASGGAKVSAYSRVMTIFVKR